MAVGDVFACEDGGDPALVGGGDLDLEGTRNLTCVGEGKLS